MTELTQAILKKLLHYNPETGHFTRLVKTAKRVKVGDIAGSIVNGYIVISIDNKSYPAHRLAFLYMNGKFPEKGFEVDHINQIRDDNSWVNLRIATRQDNMRNKSMYKNNKVGHTGVYWNKEKDKWESKIKVNGKLKHLGYFKNKDDAIAARKEAEIKYGYHKNHGTIT